MSEHPNALTTMPPASVTLPSQNLRSDERLCLHCDPPLTPAGLLRSPETRPPRPRRPIRLDGRRRMAQRRLAAPAVGRTDPALRRGPPHGGRRRDLQAPVLPRLDCDRARARDRHGRRRVATVSAVGGRAPRDAEPPAARVHAQGSGEPRPARLPAHGRRHGPLVPQRTRDGRRGPVGSPAAGAHALPRTAACGGAR